MMRRMRSPLFVATALLFVSGCAHRSEMHETSSTMMAAPAAEARQEPQGEIIAVDQQVAQPEAPRARPRLTQTITLGQSNNEATYSSPPPAPGQQGPGGTNVTVNNNVIVNQPPAVYGGWGGFGGYGYGYGGRGGYGARSDGFDRSSSARGATWGNTGWEGARGRPAAAGATPSVGGNWAPAPSYGPSQMK